MTAAPKKRPCLLTASARNANDTETVIKRFQCVEIGSTPNSSIEHVGPARRSFSSLLADARIGNSGSSTRQFDMGSEVARAGPPFNGNADSIAFIKGSY